MKYTYTSDQDRLKLFINTGSTSLDRSSMQHVNIVGI